MGRPWVARGAGLAWTLGVGVACAWAFFAPVASKVGRGATLWDRVLWALGPRPDPVLVGGGVDLLGTVWNLGELDRMLRGERGTVLPEIYAPVGWDHGLHTGWAWMDLLPSWPLVHAWGAPVAYNGHLVLQIVLTHLAVAVLLRVAGAPWSAAPPLAALVVLNPFVVEEIAAGRPTQAHLAWHALFLAAVVRLGERPSARVAAAGGVALVAACLVYWFSGAAVGVLGALAFLGQVAFARGRRWPTLRAGLVLGAVAVVVLLVALGGPILQVLAGDTPLIPDLGKGTLGVGPFEVPRVHRTVYADGWAEVGAFLVRNRFPAVAVGGGLALGALALPLAGARVLPWLVGTALVATLPLGQVVQVRDAAFLTLYPFVQLVWPPFQRAYQVDRLGVAALLGGLVVAAIATGALAARARLAGPVVALLAGAAALQARPTSLPVAPWQPHRVYQRAAALAPGGIVDVPLEVSTQTYVVQADHGQPLLGGPVMRPPIRPEAHVRYCEENGALRQLEAFAATGAPPGPLDADGLTRLHADGFRTLVVHLDRSKAPLAAWSARLGPPAATEGHAAVWRLPER